MPDTRFTATRVSLALTLVTLGLVSAFLFSSFHTLSSSIHNPTLILNNTETMASQTSFTFRVSNKTPEIYHSYSENMSALEQIKGMPHYRRNKCTEVLQMSKFPDKIDVSDNGFVRTVVNAYNSHYNLVIRPEDVWGAIMTQFSFYINKHAEKFRGKFVNFEGKKTLTVAVAGSLRSAPYDTLVKLMSKEIDRNLVDPEVKKWILPSFSTTTDNDLVTIGVVFMASMKKYFDYKFSLMCGIPSITLEGTVEDWENVRERLKKLKEYDLEKWYDMLEPVLTQFVNARQGKADTDFWQKITHYQPGGSGPSYLSGWITVFCVFDKDGNWQKTTLHQTFGPDVTDEVSKKWLRIETEDIPSGIVEVNVIIDDNGHEYKSVMFAGHVATEINENGTIVQPTLGWAIALKPEGATDDDPLEETEETF